MTDNLPLRGKVALVTGAARGIGRTYALRLADRGADVAVLDVDLHSYKDYQLEAEAMHGDTTVDEIREIGVRAIGLQVDITDSTAVDAAVQQIIGEWGGRLDIAICNAGGAAWDHPRKLAHPPSRMISSRSSSPATSPARSTPAEPWPGP